MSDLTQEVEVRLKEYSKLVDEMWDRGDVESALAGSRLIKAVRENMEATKRLRLLTKTLSEMCEIRK